MPARTHSPSLDRGTKFKVYKKARQNAAGGLDPFDLAKQEALSDLNRKLAGYAIKGFTGMPNQDLARKADKADRRE